MHASMHGCLYVCMYSCAPVFMYSCTQACTYACSMAWHVSHMVWDGMVLWYARMCVWCILYIIYIHICVRMVCAHCLAWNGMVWYVCLQGCSMQVGG